jgi:hypothetical protein
MMNAASIAEIVMACVFGGAVLGMAIRPILPDHHLSSDSKDVVKLAMGLIATMSALVLALLIASAKSSYDAQRNELTQLSANLILLDRVLQHYGPETKDTRELLRATAANLISQLWPTGEPSAAKLDPARGDLLYDQIQSLSPQNDGQRMLQAQAQKISIDLAQTRFMLIGQEGSSIPMPFLVLLVFWVTIIFFSFGLFAPQNTTVVVSLLLCAMSVSGAIYLILELDRPFIGLIQISSAPLRHAIGQLR